MILPKDIIKFAAKIEAEIGFDIYIYWVKYFNKLFKLIVI
jgi:hypothetical protein